VLEVFSLGAESRTLTGPGPIGGGGYAPTWRTYGLLPSLRLPAVAPRSGAIEQDLGQPAFQVGQMLVWRR
jgi:hypothetical protein